MWCLFCITEHLCDFTRFNWSTVTGSLTALVCPLRSLYNIYSALISRSRTTAGRVLFAGKRCLYRTVNFAPKALTHPQPFSSPQHSHSCLVKFARGDRVLSESAPTHSSRGSNMDPYFEGSYAKLGTSSCKKCKEKIEKGALRLAKVRHV